MNLSNIADRLTTLRDEIAVAMDAAGEPSGEAAASVANLLGYVQFRSHDLRDLQLELARAGLSSLGRLEPHVLFTLDQVLARLGSTPAHASAVLTPEEASALAAERATRLLGRPREGRHTRIMVTIDAKAASEGQLRELLLAGMDLARVNCAHDSPDEWARIITGLRAAEDELAGQVEGAGRRCRVIMDLAGPKIRTGPLRTRSGTVRIEVPYDASGRKTRPAAAILAPREPHIVDTDGGPPVIGLQCADESLRDLQPGSQLPFVDVRGRECAFLVEQVHESGRADVFLNHSAYLDESVTLLLPGGERVSLAPGAPQPERVRLRAGDRLMLYRDPSRLGHDNEGGRPAGIACTLPEALANVEMGHRVYIDDGKLSTIAIATNEEGVLLEVSQRQAAYRLKPEKGINFPDTRLHLAAMSPLDREHLRFVAEHADAVGLSFVHDASDIYEMQAALGELGRPDLPVVAKIETADAVHSLARILVAGLSLPSFGIMIARGDLAVEIGFENLAQVQDDILCLCEAAHVPPIWATQVLETLARSGLPARAEITDATLGQRAESVMLNKGAHIVSATRTLAALLTADARRHLGKRDLFQEFTSQVPLHDRGGGGQ